MTNTHAERFLGTLHDCYFTTDPRVNKDLASKLAGKNVLIAGAGRGIGRACAEFITHGSPRSMSLVALERDQVEETAKLCQEIYKDVKTKTGVFDVCDPDAVKQFVDEIDKDFGGVDILLMNAGRPPQWLPVAEGDPNIWWDTVSVSLRGAYNFTRYVVPIMQRQKGGRIIFTASAGAHSNRGISAYIMGKLGMVRLAEIIHAENNQDYGICAFAIQPGAIPTRFYHDFKDAAEGRKDATYYIKDGAEGEEKSAHTAANFFKNVTWDTTEMPAGMVTVLASGMLDFMSGRYLDSAKEIERYLEEKDKVVEEDLYRVRLNAGNGRLIPKLAY